MERYPFRRRYHDIFDEFIEDPWLSRYGEDIFDEFEEQIRRIHRQMNSLYRDAIRGNLIDRPRVYGWSFRIDSTGRPIFQEFGNIPNVSASKELPEIREPLVDLQETDRQIIITAEIPGVSKEDIDLEITADNLIINVDNKDRKYYKEIPLPAEVDADNSEATFNNGVLSITLSKLKPKKKGRKIKVN
ncbi:MAG: Hsp20/alpha crystallin family protein [Thermoplasmata archaeon]|nr:MAG: Hsp20/alpha crystallin family protein [Thermoplasmata archaeon]